jgi:hypothetical protein
MFLGGFMIEVKQAAEVAFVYFNDLYKGKYYNLALEEVELSNDEKYWFITLGYNPPATGFAEITGAGIKREYKQFKIDSTTGKVISMKIRGV